MRVHVSLHVAPYSKRLSADCTRVRFLSGMNATVVLQVAARSERFVAVLAPIILLARVDPSVDNQGVLPGKVFPTVLALVLFLFRVDARRMVLQVAPLAKMPAAFLAFVRLVATVKPFVHL